MKNDLIEYKNIPETFDEGSEGQVWLENDYVYKLYRRNFENPNYMIKRLEMLNSLPEYEKEELIGYMKTKFGFRYITRQKKLKDWQEILAKFYFSHHRRMRDWDKIIKQFVLDSGFIYDGEGYCKNNVKLSDIEFENVGMNDEGELKIIDARIIGLNADIF